MVRLELYHRIPLPSHQQPERLKGMPDVLDEPVATHTRRRIWPGIGNTESTEHAGASAGPRYLGVFSSPVQRHRHQVPETVAAHSEHQEHQLLWSLDEIRLSRGWIQQRSVSGCRPLGRSTPL